MYVIATSSRPDTMDPALLRPGRLDNLLFLDWPTEKERYDIMWKLTRNIKTDPDVNLCAIAAKEMPNGSTGADIKGLLSNCSVNAATRVIQAHEEALKLDPTLPNPTEVPSITAEDVRLARKSGFSRMRENPLFRAKRTSSAVMDGTSVGFGRVGSSFKASSCA